MARRLDDFLGGDDGEREELTLVPRSSIEQLLEKIQELEARVSRLEKAVEELKRARRASRQGGGSADSQGSRRGAPSGFQRALEALNDKGYVSIRSDLGRFSEDEVERVVKRVEQMGVVKLDLGEDVLLVHPRVYREFREKLQSVGERDPVACVEIFGRAGKLFNELYRRGALYYSVKEGRWRILV